MRYMASLPKQILFLFNAIPKVSLIMSGVRCAVSYNGPQIKALCESKDAFQ